jgi:CheY-like chemotaxis protein
MLPFAKTHHNTLRIDLPKDPLFVSADFSRTKQVLANLISNACKYSDPDTEVLIKAEALDGKAIVYVQNKGPGIPESFRPKMFQAFSQADSSDTRAKGGTGLGLNITKQIITRHEGEIGFESAPGGVTVFWFTYPLIDPKPEELAPIQRLEPFAKKHKARVLHLEEDADFAEVVRSGLQDVADVTHAATIEDAREILDRGDLDVVILDWALAEDASDQLLTAIGRKMPQARVLGLSSDADIHRDARVLANLEKSRMELSTLAGYVSGKIAKAS